MKKTLAILLIIMFVFCSCTVCAASSAKEVEVKLGANRALGYHWTYTVDKPDMIEEISYNYIPDTRPYAGLRPQGGHDHWIFKGLKEGDVAITFTSSAYIDRYAIGTFLKVIPSRKIIHTYHIDKNLNMKLISVNEPSKTTITLHSKPSTGYIWTYSADKEDMIKVVSHTYSPASTFTGIPVHGAGGDDVWTFQALKEGDVTLTFAYIRPNAKDKMGPELKKFKFHIDSDLNIELVSSK